MIWKIFKIYLLVQFSFNFHIFPATCERINFQKTEILKQNNKYFTNSPNSNCSINELILRKENSIENEQLPQSDWFSNIPLLPISVATSNSIPEGPCKTQLRLFLNHLKNGTLWAVEMFDSSAKYPYGIFDGLNRYLGSFDQCNRIQTIVLNKKNEKLEKIRSKYCLVDIKYQKNPGTTNFTRKHDFAFDPQGSAWEALRETENVGRYQRNILQMALCFPSKCHTEDIIAALKDPLEKFNAQFNIQVDATIHPEYCHENHETSKFSNYNRAFCFFLFVIIGLVVTSTILETNCIQHENDYCFSRKILACFSARRSFNVIFKVNYNHNAFDCVHLIRCIFASITIFSHRNLELMQGGNINGLYYEKALSKPFLGLIYNPDNAVDGFFGMSGIVLSYYLLEFLETSKQLKIFSLLFNRFIRIAPLYMFMTFAYAFLIHHLGSGPFWENRLGFDQDVCSSNWWTNLFFINNYVVGQNMCVMQSWYLAVDFHCYIIGLLLIGAFHKMSRKSGYIFLGCILIISAAIPFYFTYKNNIDPFIRIDLRERRIDAIDYAQNYYIKTHMRLSAYFVGLIVGTVMYDYKFAEWRLSKFWSHVLFILQVVTLPLLFQWLGCYFIDENSHPSLFSKALYASLHRPIFAFGVCSILLLITIGQGLDCYYKLLTPRWIQPFSRLSYAMFLTHFAIQSYELGTARTAFTYSSYNLIRNFIGDLVYASLLSLVVVILIEKPFTNLAKLLLEKQKPKASKTPFNSDKKEE